MSDMNDERIAKLDELIRGMQELRASMLGSVGTPAQDGSADVVKQLGTLEWKKQSNGTGEWTFLYERGTERLLPKLQPLSGFIGELAKGPRKVGGFEYKISGGKFLNRFRVSSSSGRPQ
jgi:hypothetical protein